MWQFPKGRSSCPYVRCNFVSDSRSKLIAHYKTKHAMNSILCDVCNKPVSSRLDHFRLHFQRMHPSVKISYGLGNGMAKIIRRKPMGKISITSKQSKKNIKVKKAIVAKKEECKYCNTVLSSGNLMRHISEVHSLNKILCPLKDCTFDAKRVSKLREHWNKEHTSFRFPEIRMRYVFTYPIAIATTSSNTDQEIVSYKRLHNCSS